MPPVVAVVGPTGSGKSAAAQQAAERIGAEIVAVDAFTVYRGMDIGTAKPSAGERARVPHHMVDVREPEDDCTVQWFQDRAREAVAEAQERGRPVLLVGGSGLYFRAVVDPLEFPPTDPEVRAAVEQRLGGDPVAAHAELAARDPRAAAHMDPGNLRRAVRALEVLELTGRPFSDWRQAWDRHDAAIYDGMVVLGVEMPRGELSERIRLRTEAMLAAGWLAEAEALRHRALSTTARQALGYAELFAHLDGGCTLEEAAERIATRTRRYAASQARWFRADPRVRWLPQAALAEEITRCVS